MIPMAMRKKEIIEQDLPLLDKCLYFSTKAARVNKNPDSGLVVCHQITVDSEAPHGKTPEYQIGHHDTYSHYVRLHSVRLFYNQTHKMIAVLLQALYKKRVELLNFRIRQ